MARQHRTLPRKVTRKRFPSTALRNLLALHSLKLESLYRLDGRRYAGIYRVLKLMSYGNTPVKVYTSLCRIYRTTRDQDNIADILLALEDEETRP